MALHTELVRLVVLPVFSLHAVVVCLASFFLSRRCCGFAGYFLSLRWRGLADYFLSRRGCGDENMRSSWPDSAPCAPNQRGLARLPHSGRPSLPARWRAPKVAHILITAATAALNLICKVAGTGGVLGMLSTASVGSKELMRSSCEPRQPGYSDIGAGISDGRSDDCYGDSG